MNDNLAVLYPCANIRVSHDGETHAHRRRVARVRYAMEEMTEPRLVVIDPHH